jgi:alpha-tubulin suppressor-like RCC1 family protein
MTGPNMRIIKVVAIGGIALLACNEPVAPTRGGRLIVGALLAPGDNAVLDSGHIIVEGPTPSSRTVTPGSTTTIGGLQPGSYSVALQGFAAGAVSHFGKTTGVAVIAGQNTAASVTFVPFSTTPTPLPDSVIGKQFNLSFTAATGAVSYLVEWTMDQTFASGVTASSSPGTTFQVTVPDYARYYVRVRAVDPYQGRGPASSLSIRTVPVNSAVKLAFTVQPPANTTADQAIPAVQVTIQDSIDRTVPAATIAVSIAIGTNPTGATLAGTTTENAVSGVATFSGLSITKAGTGYTLTGSASGLTGTTSGTFSIQAGPAAKLVFTVQPPSNTTAGQAMSPAVQVVIQDSYGNTVPVATDAVTMALGTNPSGATLKGATASPSSGVATFSALSIDRPGSYTLFATSGALTPATSSPFASHVTFVEISVGGHHTCGRTTSGTAYCWGSNDSGQVGDSTYIARSTPTPAVGGLVFTAISAGRDHTCGLSAGKAYCWGSNVNGALGDGTFTKRSYPKEVNGGFTFTAVTAGGYHSCGVVAGGAAYCWGSNGYGQVGDSTKGNVRVNPTKVGGTLTFAEVSAGVFHTCAVTTGGTAYCWGANIIWQLGVGVDTTSRASPVQVTGSLTFAKVRAGLYHTCGVTTGSSAYCWGNNGNGQLGVGDTTSRANPVAVSGLLTFAGVHPGWYHTCGVTSGGIAYCWGYNGDGELGDGTTTQRLSPMQVSTSLIFATVGAGDLHTCGLTTALVAYCWGANDSGQLGNGSASGAFVPVAVVQ